MDNQFDSKDSQPPSSADQPGSTVQPGMKSDGSASSNEPPQPFTMDNPAQSTTEPAPPPPQSNEPHAFTMDDQSSTASASPSSSPSSEQTGIHASSMNIDGVNDGSPAVGAPLPGASIQPGQSVDDMSSAPEASPSTPAPQPQISPDQPPVAQDQAAGTDAPAHNPVQPPVNQPNLDMAAASPPQASPAGPLTSAKQPPASPNQPPQMAPSSEPNGDSKGSGWKKRAPIIAAALVLAGAVAGVFGWYIPNRPENVYRTGLDRTGQMIEQLDEQFAAVNEIVASEGFEMDGEMAVRAEEVSFAGTMSARSSAGSSETSVDISGELGDDSLGMNMSIGFDAITDIAEGNDYPDVFFRLRGGEFLSMTLPVLGDLSDQWVQVDAEVIDEFVGELSEEAEDEGDFGGYMELVQDIGETINEYVFTSDDKSIIQLDEIVGAEERNGVRTYRYDVSINQENTEPLCAELYDTINESAFIRGQLGGLSESSAEERDDDIAECVNGLENFDNEIDMTMWIDRRTKMIHQLRFEDDDGFRLEVGQTYDRTDEFDVFLRASDDELELDFVMTIDNAKPSIAMTFDVWLDEMEDDDEFTVSMTMEPFDGPVEIERPTDTIDFEEFVERLFSGFFMGPSNPLAQPGLEAESFNPSSEDDFFFDDDDFFFDEPAGRQGPGFIQTLERLVPQLLPRE